MISYKELGLPPPGKAHVISYTRFSTRKQELGHSKQRQDDAARKWCLEYGYELDLNASIHDPGFSAYSAAHLKNGGLGVLQRAAMDGELHNTVLLIEAFDRLTRMELTRAYELLLSLVNNGVAVVTLTDGKVWSEKTLKSLEAFMLSLVTLFRGYQESERKSGILREKFETARKQRIQSTFGSAPGWLKRKSKNSPWEVDEKKAEVVRRIFQMAADGYGSKAISKRAIEEGWPTPTRKTSVSGRWHGRMAGIILRNEAVLGVHEHRIATYEAKAEDWRGKPTGIVYHDYYPRIVSDELWAAAKASIETRRKDKRRDTHYYNIFSGLMYCGYCGAPMHRRTETRGFSRATIVCADKVSGATTCPSGAAVTIDAPLLEAIFTHAPRATNDDGSDIELANQEADIRAYEQEIRNVTETIAKVGPLDALVEKLNQSSLALTICKAAKSALLSYRENLGSTTDVNDEYVRDAISKLYVPDLDARDFRSALHLKIARLIDTIWVWNYEVAVVDFKHSGDRIVVPLDFKRLPSRANTLSKWHRPAPPKSPPPRPHLEAGRAGTLRIPKPRRVLNERARHADSAVSLLPETTLPATLPIPDVK